MPYVSNAPMTQRTQQAVQTLQVQLGDAQIVAVSGSTVTIDCGQSIANIREVLNYSNSLATVVPIVAANRVIATNLVTLTLANPLAANDGILMHFVLAK